MAIVHTKYEVETGTAQFIVADPSTKKCAIIDSVLDFNISTSNFTTTSAKQLIQIIQENGYELEWILDTHIHADHVTASHYLKTQFPSAKIGISDIVKKVRERFAPMYNQCPQENTQFWDVFFNDEDEFKIGDLNVKVIGLPGHTPACLGYYIEDDSVFTGDTVFLPDVGTARCDFPGGSAETLWESIQKLLSKITKNTKIYVGHDYGLGGKREVKTETTFDEILSANIHLKEGIDKGQFIEFRNKRDTDLALPRLFHASIQLNIRAGQFPPPSPNGKTFIVYPVALIEN